MRNAPKHLLLAPLQWSTALSYPVSLVALAALPSGGGMAFRRDARDGRSGGYMRDLIFTFQRNGPISAGQFSA